jgi:hypothetical protein
MACRSICLCARCSNQGVLQNKHATCHWQQCAYSVRKRLFLAVSQFMPWVFCITLALRHT